MKHAMAQMKGWYMAACGEKLALRKADRHHALVKMRQGFRRFRVRAACRDIPWLRRWWRGSVKQRGRVTVVVLVQIIWVSFGKLRRKQALKFMYIATPESRNAGYIFPKAQEALRRGRIARKRMMFAAIVKAVRRSQARDVLSALGHVCDALCVCVTAVGCTSAGGAEESQGVLHHKVHAVAWKDDLQPVGLAAQLPEAPSRENGTGYEVPVLSPTILSNCAALLMSLLRKKHWGCICV